jgi:NADH-quinone oxidoreductase subunit N
MYINGYGGFAYLLVFLPFSLFAGLFGYKIGKVTILFSFATISQSAILIIGITNNYPEIGASSFLIQFIYSIHMLVILLTLIVVGGTRNVSVYFSSLRGLKTLNYNASFLLSIALVSLAGLPPFVGFLSKNVILSLSYNVGPLILFFLSCLSVTIQGAVYCYVAAQL